MSNNFFTVRDIGDSVVLPMSKLCSVALSNVIVGWSAL